MGVFGGNLFEKRFSPSLFQKLLMAQNVRFAQNKTKNAPARPNEGLYGCNLYPPPAAKYFAAVQSFWRSKNLFSKRFLADSKGSAFGGAWGRAPR
jgi:hypothetical protein